MSSNSSRSVYQRLVSSGDSHLERMEELHRCHYNALLSYGCAITRQRELVKDAIQDLFLWLLARSDRLDGIVNVEAYLFTALRQNLRGKLKSRGVVRSLTLESNQVKAVDLPTPAIDNRIIAEEHLEYRREILTKEIDALPDRLREALYLRYFTQLTYKEIAEVMAINPQVAKNFVSRGLKKLRHNLCEHKQSLISILLLFLFSFL